MAVVIILKFIFTLIFEIKIHFFLFYYRELCNLCTERAERNVPVYTREAEEAADKMAARVLVNAEQRRGFLFLLF